MPHLDMCLFMLLCISTLVVANIVVEEECELIDESERSLTNQRIEKQVLGKHVQGINYQLASIGQL